MLKPTELRCSPYCATLHPTELQYTLHSYVVPFGVTMHSLAYTAVQCCILLSYNAPLSYISPYGAEFDPSEFSCNLGANLYPTELLWTLLIYA